MPTFNTDMDNPPRFQWESSSGTFECSQAVNCGPTGSTQQADYKRNDRFPIERTRTNAGVAPCRPTNAWEQAAMLTKRGWPATVREIDSLSQLDALVGYHGKRPVGIGVLMGRMSAKTRGHAFLGWHRITILKRHRKFIWSKMQWVGGYYYTDPNFSPPGGYRPDPKRGHRWISRAALRYAFIRNSPRYAIVPDYKKG